MHERPRDARLCLEYLPLDDQDLIAHTLRHVESWCGQTTDLEFFTQTVHVLAKWNAPTHAIQVMLAYHLLEREGSSSGARRDLFAEHILHKAEEVRNLVHPPFRDATSAQDGNVYRQEHLRHLFCAAYVNWELALLCLALHETKMRAIEQLAVGAPEDAQLLAHDSDAIFLPLAEMLGLWQLRCEWGDLSLAVLNPRRGRAQDGITKDLKKSRKEREEKSRKEREQVFNQIYEKLWYKLVSAGISPTIALHNSPPCNIYRRMLGGDTLAKLARRLRIDMVLAAEDELECYRVLGLLHQEWPPTKEQKAHGSRFRDLIAVPKFNGYRALTTTVRYGEKLLLKFRIRTEKMEETNTWGIIAAKWRSQGQRQQSYSKGAVPIKNVWWENEEFQHLIETNPLGSRLRDYRTGKIYVFTPTGEVCLLPQGATWLDYAYSLHSEIGHHCTRAWINGRQAALAQQLCNGDIVTIDVNPSSPGPREEWLQATCTSLAQKNIKRALHQRSRTPQEDGRKIIDKILEYECRAYKLALSPAEKDKLLEQTAQRYHYASLSDLYCDIATPERVHWNVAPSLIQEVAKWQVSPSRFVASLIATHLAGDIVRADYEPIGVPKDRVSFAHFNDSAHKRETGRSICRVSLGSRIVGHIVEQGTRYERLVVYNQSCPVCREKAKNMDTIALDWRSPRPRRVPGQIPNPYTPGPARDQRIFKGRNAEVRQIIESLGRGEKAVVVHGFTQVGKTSLLYRLSDDLKDYGFATAFVDLQPIGKDQAEQLWLRIIDSIECSLSYRFSKTDEMLSFKKFQEILKESLEFPVTNDQSKQLWLRITDSIENSHPYRLRIIESGVSFFEELQRVLEESSSFLRRSKKSLVIIIDEVSLLDTLWNAEEAEDVITKIKSLIWDNSNHDISFVFCAQESVYSKKCSTLFPIFSRAVSVEIKYLDSNAATDLIKQPIEENMAYNDNVIREIINVTACHPFYLQRLLKKIIEHMNEKEEGEKEYAQVGEKKVPVVTSADLEIVIDQICQGDGGDLFFHFRNLHAQAQLLLSTLADPEAAGDRYGTTLDRLHEATELPKQEVAQRLEVLERSGIVARTEEPDAIRFSIRVPLFARWGRENLF